MTDVFDVFGEMLGDRSMMMLALMVFLAVAVSSFGLMVAFRARGAVKRRAAGIAEYTGERSAGEQRSLRHSSLRAVQRLLDYTSKHYSANESGDTKVLRRRMIHAGIFDPRAVAFFFVARTGLAVALAVAAFTIAPMFFAANSSMLWLMVVLSGILGYLAPGLYLDRRIAGRRNEHRAGFPDFMDLLVVCADSGLSMEAALERVGRELGDSYPSLCTNLHMANLEIRAGRSMTEALEHLGDRLGSRRRARSPPSSSSPPSSAPASPTRCGSIATTCATSGSRSPRRRPTACRRSSRFR